MCAAMSAAKGAGPLGRTDWQTNETSTLLLVSTGKQSELGCIRSYSHFWALRMDSLACRSTADGRHSTARSQETTMHNYTVQ